MKKIAFILFIVSILIPKVNFAQGLRSFRDTMAFYGPVRIPTGASSNYVLRSGTTGYGSWVSTISTLDTTTVLATQKNIQGDVKFSDTSSTIATKKDIQQATPNFYSVTIAVDSIHLRNGDTILLVSPPDSLHYINIISEFSRYSYNSLTYNSISGGSQMYISYRGGATEYRTTNQILIGTTSASNVWQSYGNYNSINPDVRGKDLIFTPQCTFGSGNGTLYLTVKYSIESN